MVLIKKKTIVGLVVKNVNLWGKRKFQSLLSNRWYCFCYRYLSWPRNTVIGNITYDMVMCVGRCDSVITEARELYRQRYSNHPLPSYSSANVEECGSCSNSTRLLVYWPTRRAFWTVSVTVCLPKIRSSKLLYVLKICMNK